MLRQIRKYLSLLLASGWSDPNGGSRHIELASCNRYGSDPKDPRFRTPLEDHAAELNAALDESSQVILLGSLASDKYVSILSPIFGQRLVAPRSFVGIGDMSRGALLLRAAVSRSELDYMPVSASCLRLHHRSSTSSN